MELKQAVQYRLNQIAKRHLLKPSLLQNIIWGRAHGWSQIKISKEYNINQNTVSKYSRILEREITDNELKILLLVIVLIGELGEEETFICKLCKKKKPYNDLDILNFDGDCICADCDKKNKSDRL